MLRYVINSLSVLVRYDRIENQSEKTLIHN